MPPYRLLVTPPRSGPDNMALDDALMTRARETGDCLLRVYAWATPTLSFGRHQRAVGVYDPDALAARGLDVVRRPTGGRSVLHHREITYSVAAPVDAPLRATYARINRWLLAALETLGVAAREATPARRAPIPDGAPCFETPTGGELVVDLERGSAKLVGSAQWQDDGALLQHGSILVDDDQSTVASLSAQPHVVPPPATLRAVLGRAPSPHEFADALAGAVERVEGTRPAPLPFDDRLCAATCAARARYVDPGWTWRR